MGQSQGSLQDRELLLEQGGPFEAGLWENPCPPSGVYLPAGPGRSQEEQEVSISLIPSAWLFHDRAGQAFTILEFLREADFGRTSGPFGNVRRREFLNSENVFVFLLPGMPLPPVISPFYQRRLPWPPCQAGRLLIPFIPSLNPVFPSRTHHLSRGQDFVW